MGMRKVVRERTVKVTTAQHRQMPTKVPWYVCDGCSAECEGDVSGYRPGDDGCYAEASSWNIPMNWMRVYYRATPDEELFFCETCSDRMLKRSQRTT